MIASEQPYPPPSHLGFDWPVGGRDPFDPADDGALWFYWAYGRPSLAFRRRELDLHDDLDRAIPHGRTALALLRRTALLEHGNVVSDWSGDPSGSASYVVVLPGDRYLCLETGLAPTWHAVEEALELSRRVTTPVLLARQEWTKDWW